MKKINWDYWKKRDSWTLLEAFLLLLGIEPEPIKTPFEQTPENNFGNVFKNATSLGHLRQLLILTLKRKKFNINVIDVFDPYPVELFFIDPQDLVVQFYWDPETPQELIRGKDYSISSDGKEISFRETPDVNPIVECSITINRIQIKKYLHIIDLIFDGIYNETLPCKKTHQEYNVIPAKFVSWCLKKKLNISDEFKEILNSNMLDSLCPLPYLDATHEYYSKELAIAVKTWMELFNEPKKILKSGKRFKVQIKEHLKKLHDVQGTEALERISTVINPDKSKKGGSSSIMLEQ
jgi:hypothetical protein